ncbi:DUF4270 domain-containing protein [Seonamhaeicola sediminis]|uniref:DUF4270 domain-containing protein n=1 Tax=Seonamhaeicola sediminis TaxID=2528206 RepID=A0A562YCJ2_9FLAO|nr:DUF4270 domain-containing protein [Seonamhaeicola sediminis]TWO32177.1 DUF4270 domain-containing protein [Seonamhaeicola sediminis]
MKKKIKVLKVPAIILLFVTSFIACDKEFYVLDSDVLGKDNANFDTDENTLPILSFNKKLDSVQINNLPSNLLGFYEDPEFGATTASVITQILPTSFNPDFGEEPIIDSVVLSIPYFSRVIGVDEITGNSRYSISDSLYGNENAQIKLSIYQNEYFLRDFNPDNLGEQQNYFSYAGSGTTDNFARTDNSIINFDNFKGALIKDISFTPSSEAIELWEISGTDTTKSITPPALRIMLDPLFWKTTIIDKQGSADLSNANNFKNYFRGLYFKAENIGGDGNMALLNFGSSDAQITIYYTRKSGDSRIKASYAFNFNGKRLNTFINNFNYPIPEGDRTNGDEKLYLKGVEGGMATVDLFHGLVEYTDDNNNTSNIPALEAFKKTFRALDNEGNYIVNNSTGDFVLKKLINQAHLIVYEDETINTGVNDSIHKYDRIYAYDLENNTPTFDYFVDPTENTGNPNRSKVINLGLRQKDDEGNYRYKIRITEHLNNILLKDSTNTKIGLVLSNNVNITSNSEILQSEDVVTQIPAASVIAPRGTIVHGTNSSDPDKQMKLKLFFTDPK